ncbi:transporter substrate-binding domain-containing protein [Herbaspirillum sp. HC18]|nr:transporter substrate-binding domain-containing protein [Herbaspirillum sp. HC18]
MSKSLFGIFLITTAAIASVDASGAAATEKAKQRGKLIAGLHYIVPEYQAGTKFRTPEALDNALLDDVAKRMGLPLATVRTEPGKPVRLLDAGKTDIVLTAVSQTDPLHRTHIVIPTGYSASPMAIMRTDTDIKTWEQLKGRKVCLSEGGLYAGTLAARYGAVEMVYKAPADSLIAVRTGECDAAVHDSAMLEELVKYPEWKKFSARLPAGPRTALSFVVPAADKHGASFLRKVVDNWAADGHLDKLMKKAVRDIAFEVYLDQSVPDCH